MTATPDGDRRIGDVEGPEVVGVPVHVDEIDDRSGGDAIDQVAGRAADDERQADAGDELMVRQARGIHADARRAPQSR